MDQTTNSIEDLVSINQNQKIVLNLNCEYRKARQAFTTILNDLWNRLDKLEFVINTGVILNDAVTTF